MLYLYCIRLCSYCKSFFVFFRFSAPRRSRFFLCLRACRSCPQLAAISLNVFVSFLRVFRNRGSWWRGRRTSCSWRSLRTCRKIEASVTKSNGPPQENPRSRGLGNSVSCWHLHRAQHRRAADRAESGGTRGIFPKKILSPEERGTHRLQISMDSRPSCFMKAEIFRMPCITRVKCSGVSDCLPSESAFCGFGCISIMRPSAPAAIAA